MTEIVLWTRGLLTAVEVDMFVWAVYRVGVSMVVWHFLHKIVFFAESECGPRVSFV